VTEPRRFTVIVCQGPVCGDKRNAGELYRRLEGTLAARGLSEQILLWRETCLGHCLRGPNILVCETDQVRNAPRMGKGGGIDTAVLYNRMTLADLDRMIDRHLLGGMVVRPFLNRLPVKD
jgi:(2Fe-2S) ferredoxin